MPCDSGPSPNSTMRIDLDYATRVACELANLLTDEQVKRISYDAALWIKRHQALDEQRKTELQRKQERIQLAAKARAKLTAEEREALGVR